MSTKTKIGYYLLRSLTFLVQLFPLRLHYFFSDILFPVVYHVVRYRRSVVFKNLNNSFPDKSKIEIELIAKKFYRFFCDCFIETLYYDRISADEIKKRHTILNKEVVEEFLAEGRQVIVVFAHYNNWEWNCSMSLYIPYSGNVVYKRLTNSSFDHFYFKMRSQFGITPIERSDTYRHLIANYNNHEASATAFLMDQTPRKFEIQYWTTFLNQETPILTGAEKISKKLDAAVLFCNVRKLKRGYNRLEFSLIAAHAKNTEPFEITEKATRMIEEMIIENPEYWLWTHKRWKHKREANARLKPKD